MISREIAARIERIENEIGYKSVAGGRSRDQLTKHQRLVVVLTLATSRGRVDRLARFGRQRSRTIARSSTSALLPTSGISPQLPPRNGRGRESGLRLQNRPADDAFAVAAAIVQFERRLHCGISGDHAQ